LQVHPGTALDRGRYMSRKYLSKNVGFG
jgi:hypothetical protein